MTTDYTDFQDYTYLFKAKPARLSTHDFLHFYSLAQRVAGSRKNAETSPPVNICPPVNTRGAYLQTHTRCNNETTRIRAEAQRPPGASQGRMIDRTS